MTAAEPPHSADAGASTLSRPLGILLAHAVDARDARATPAVFDLTASVRTGRAAAAAGTTAGVAGPPEPGTTVLAAGASAKAGLREGEQYLPRLSVHVTGLLGAVS